MVVKFTVPGEPKSKGRHRTTKSGTKYTPEGTVLYENLIKSMYFQQCKNYRFADGVPLDVRIIAYFPIPKGASKKKQAEMIAHKIRPTVKCDWDNIGKVVCDALNQIAFHDDKQVVDGQVRKFYAETPRVVVSIREAEKSA